MNRITLLRWSLVAVLGIGAGALLVTRPAPPAVALGVAELVGAALLVVPRTRVVGAVLLFAVLAAAAVLHAVLGQVPPIAFVVYAAALAVVMRREAVA